MNLQDVSGWVSGFLMPKIVQAGKKREVHKHNRCSRNNGGDPRQSKKFLLLYFILPYTQVHYVVHNRILKSII